MDASMYELVTVSVLSCGATVTAQLIINGLRQRKNKDDPPDAKMIEFMTQVRAALESIAGSQEQIAKSQADFNTNLALMIQNIERIPEDIRTAVRDAIGSRDNGRGRRFYDSGHSQ